MFFRIGGLKTKLLLPPCTESTLPPSLQTERTVMTPAHMFHTGPCGRGISDRCCSHTNLVLTWLLHRGSSSALSPSPIPKSTDITVNLLLQVVTVQSYSQQLILAAMKCVVFILWRSTEMASTRYSTVQRAQGTQPSKEVGGGVIDPTAIVAWPSHIPRRYKDHAEPDRPGLCVQSSTRGNCRPLTILSSRCFNLFEKPGVRSASR